MNSCYDCTLNPETCNGAGESTHADCVDIKLIDPQEATYLAAKLAKVMRLNAQYVTFTSLIKHVHTVRLAEVADTISYLEERAQDTKLKLFKLLQEGCSGEK